MSNEIVVSVNHVYKSFGDSVIGNETVILKDINFEVRHGEFVSIMGPSGCGKSTLLYLIGGLDNPTSGHIITCGYELAGLNDNLQSKIRCQDIGFVFQFYNLVQNLSVEENILLPIVMAGKAIRKKEYSIQLDNLLEIMGLGDKRRSLPYKLSGGQQQRVAIARAVMGNPGLILADEPTGNLDSQSGTEVLKTFERINNELGISIIMVTHSEEASKYGRRILRMQDGVILSDNAVRKG